jgi:hypothetical protein
MREKRSSKSSPDEAERAAEEEGALDGQALEEVLDKAERELRQELAEEGRKLRELGRLLPGPDTPDPKDKIWRYLIAEYGFSPRVLSGMSYKDMKRYVEARQAPKPPSNTRPELNDTELNGAEQCILEALGDKRLTGQTIAELAGYPFNSNFRTTLAGLRKRGIIGNKGRGYFRGNAGG